MSNCDECTLQGNYKVDPTGKSKSPQIAFVGEFAFNSKSEKLLRQSIEYMGLDDKDCYFTYICLCDTPEKRKYSAKEIACCFPRLQVELEEVKPSIIIALGATAGKAVIPSYTTITESRGSIRESITGSPSILTYHPNALLYPKGETSFPNFLSDLKKVKQLINGEKVPFEDAPLTVYHAITPEEVDKMLDFLLKVDTPKMAYDWETTGVSALTDTGFCFGIAWSPTEAVVIPMSSLRGHIYKLNLLFKRQDIHFVAFNGFFDGSFNERTGFPFRVDGDPMLAHYCIDERPQRRNLENLSVEYCNAPRYESEMLAKYDCSKADMIYKVPPEKIYDYNGYDCIYTYRLDDIFMEELDKYSKLRRVYHDILIKAQPVYWRMYKRGLWVDLEKLQEITELYETKVADLLVNLKEVTGNLEFNPNSHPQVQKFLWDEMQLEEPEIYGRKERSANKETRKELLELYPNAEFVEILHEYKTMYTLLSRYLRKIRVHTNSDNRVRCSIHFDRTETGRLSATNPPLHQIPRESDIRTVFGAPPGHKLLQADYEQIEIRWAAVLGKDTKLTQLLRSGVDFHTKMASEAFLIPYDKVTPEQRQAAKEVSFGVLYLMSDKMLAEKTGLPIKKALSFVKSYKGLMPGVQDWIAQIKDDVSKKRYVESFFGRRRRFPLITKLNLAGLQREAVNMPIQSSASDLTLLKAMELHEIFTKKYPEVHMVLTVHDSIIAECPDPLVHEVSVLMKQVMEDMPFKTDVPFPVEIKIGTHLGQGEKLKL